MVHLSQRVYADLVRRLLEGAAMRRHCFNQMALRRDLTERYSCSIVATPEKAFLVCPIGDVRYPRAIILVACGRQEGAWLQRSVGLNSLRPVLPPRFLANSRFQLLGSRCSNRSPTVACLKILGLAPPSQSRQFHLGNANAGAWIAGPDTSRNSIRRGIREPELNAGG
jgi:hypothetical protein